MTGAQAKTALHLSDGRWGVPSGATPTTHILKVPLPDFDGFVENEHLTLELASACGLNTARSSVMVFGEEIAIVVERFDRASVAGEVRRIHQEDLCQALGVSPLRKYEADGGPGAEELFGLIEEHGSDAYQDVERATDALLFSWLTAGTDAHAKNYSLLLGPDGLARLSPLYDLATAAPYPFRSRRRE